MYELSQDLGNMNLDKNTRRYCNKIPHFFILYFLCQHKCQNLSKTIFTRQLHFVNQQKLYIWEFLKNKVITNLKNKSIFRVSILVLINILQYSLMGKSRYKSIFKKIKKKNFRKFFSHIFYKIWLIFQFQFWKKIGKWKKQPLRN